MQKLAEIFWLDVRPLKLLTIPLCVLAAVGVLLRTHDMDADGDMMLILHVLSPAFLVLALSYIGIARLVGLFIWEGVAFTKVITPMLGIAIWCLFFASAAMADDFGMGLLYLVAAFMETWICSRAIADYRDTQ